MPPEELPFRQRASFYLSDMVLSGIMKAALALPPRPRGALIGGLVSGVIAPLTGWRKRIRANLALAWPELNEMEVERLVHKVPANFARTLSEIYEGDGFARRLDGTEIEGPGRPALDQAHAEGRPVILVSGHFGNWDAVRSAVTRRYSPVGAVYRPLNNPYSERHWARALAGIASPVFPRSRRGLAEMVRYLRQGNMIAILHDQHFSQGIRGTYFGQPVTTAPSAAEMALKYDAVLIPSYGVRLPGNQGFRILMQAPIAHTDAATMTQAMNDSLEGMVRQYPDQWFWIHRRWKARKEA